MSKEIVETNNEILPPDEDIDLDQLEKVGEVFEKIERAKQEAAIKQIEATDKDNERQYNYALKELEVEEKKWNKSFIAGSIFSGLLTLSGLYLLLFTPNKDIGLGLLASTLTGVFGYLAGVGTCKHKT